jgi:hypothetical protein
MVVLCIFFTFAICILLPVLPKLTLLPAPPYPASRSAIAIAIIFFILVAVFVFRLIHILWVTFRARRNKHDVG